LVRVIVVSDDDGGHAIDIRQDGRRFCRSALARDGVAWECRIKRELDPTNTRESSTAIAMGIAAPGSPDAVRCEPCVLPVGARSRAMKRSR